MRYAPGRKHAAAIITHDMPRCISAIIANRARNCSRYVHAALHAGKRTLSILKQIVYSKLILSKRSVTELVYSSSTAYSNASCSFLQSVTKNTQRYSMSKNNCPITVFLVTLMEIVRRTTVSLFPPHIFTQWRRQDLVRGGARNEEKII